MNLKEKIRIATGAMTWGLHGAIVAPPPDFVNKLKDCLHGGDLHLPPGALQYGQ
jgi:hypothetical protein